MGGRRSDSARPPRGAEASGKGTAGSLGSWGGVREGAAFRMCRENAAVAPLGCLPMRRCGRKKGLLMVESSGCAAFGHPAAIQGSLPTTIGRRLERRQRPVRPAFGVAAASDQSRCPCRARLVSLAAGASRVPPAGSVAAPAACSQRGCARRQPSAERNYGRALGAAALSRAEGHATTARREPNPSSPHRVAERRHAPCLRIPRQPGRARWNAFACCKGSSIQPQSGRFLVAPYRIAREATRGGRVPACHHEFGPCPTKC